MTYLKNAWYVSALSTEIGPQALFHRKILGTSILIYRKQDGAPVALHDRCPHRFAPLHLGKRDGDQVVCMYHALRFDCSGKCTHNPHGEGRIPQAAVVKSFPLVEKFGLVWIWMGEEAADAATIPDFSALDNGHPNAIGYTYMHMKANYELITDNVMDLSHIDHLHGEIITTRGQLSPQVPRIVETPRSISARWEWEQTPAMLIFADFLPQPKDEARHFFDITWTPPSNIQLSVGAVQGAGSLDLDGCVGQYDLHTTTPETDDSTHYFFVTRRNHIVDDAGYNEMKIKAMHAAFENEDGPIINAVHEEMGTTDFFSLKPVLMSNDVAPVKVRRLLAKLIADENRSSIAAPVQ
jgi:phenylpropionate dioxygenase-like ring-hydroxylating dioxygenase large terminal subunit